MSEPTPMGEPRDIFPEQDDDIVDAKKPVTARGVAIVGARVVTGLVGVGIAAVTIGASVLVPLPTANSVPPSQVVVPVPTAQQLVCPGAVLRLADETGQGATTSSAIGIPDARYFSSTGSIDAAPLEQSDASTGGTRAAPVLVSTPPDQADPSQQLLLSGAQSQPVNEDEFVGLAAADCGVASGDIWLAGGSTSVGRTTLLTMSNPTEVPATVNLQLFGETGPITAPGTSGIIVPANGQRVLSLAGFQPDVVSPVVHISSTGGQVVAELQESIVRGLDAGGVDIVGPTTSPSTLNVIPGLVLANVPAVQALRVGGTDYDDLAAVLRMYAPGATATVATTISVIPEDGGGNGTSFSYDVDAGRVVDVPIGDLADGSYTVTIASAVPIVAAARVSTAQSGGPTDFAWLASSAELQDHAQFTVAPGSAPMLHLANQSAADAAVVLTPQGAALTTVPVPAGSSVSVPVQSGATYEATGFGTLYAAISLVEGGTIARYAVHPPGVGSSPVTVYR